METRVRNASLKWVRKHGSHHVLIVDGDELWLRGTLNIVRAAAERGVAALALRMIPAIGLPALPIEGATDLAVVYIGPGEHSATVGCRGMLPSFQMLALFTSLA